MPSWRTKNIFPQVDTLPVGFSRHWLQDILRSQLNFKGPILTDDLNMEAANISTNYADRVSAAREAGCDFTLLCNNRKAVINVLDSLSQTKFHSRSRNNGENYKAPFNCNQSLLAKQARLE